jgi:hypothetical protein
MANNHRNSFTVGSPDPYLCQPQLLTVVSKICPHRRCRPNPRVCRLIFDGRLEWEVEPIDGNRSWLYLPKPVRARHMAGCLILTLD